MVQGRARRRVPRKGEGGVLVLDGRYAQARGADGKGLLLDAPARTRTVGCEAQRGRLPRGCARRSRGGGTHAEVRSQKAEESSAAWTCSEVFFGGERGSHRNHHRLVMRQPAHVTKQHTNSNFALPEGVILTGWMPSSPVVESKKRRKVWCGWTPLSVPCSATWKVSFSFSFGPKVTGSGRFVRDILFELFFSVRAERIKTCRVRL